jgi:4-amino-4-deoxy-L-arabinose transferase-like glycosyltransferase
MNEQNPDEMNALKTRRKKLLGDPVFLALLAMAFLILLTLLYSTAADLKGFHRDELNFIENARHLSWGYIEYPPLTPFIGWIVLQLAGPSPLALRFAAGMAVCIALWLTGLMTYELGGDRLAQSVAMLASGTAPLVLFNDRFFSYQTFDYLWWVLAAYGLVRLLKSENPRWWLLLGATLGLGMMTKYSIPYLVAGIAIGILLTPARRFLKTPWLWMGAGLALLLFLPNLIWQVQHHFISLDFLSVTRTVNIRAGRTELLGFITQQFYVCTNAASITLWIGGLVILLTKAEAKKYRMLGWIYIITFLLFLLSQGRFYYIAGCYPVLIAVGASQTIHAPKITEKHQTIWGNMPFLSMFLYASLLIVGLFDIAVAFPLTPVQSPWWQFSASLNSEIREYVGWPELVQEVADIYQNIPASQRETTGILARNYGEAGAINLYGPALGLPEAISPADTSWLRGYGKVPPQTLIVVGMSASESGRYFSDCVLSGHNPNPYHIQNEETRDHPDIFTCQHPINAWPVFWDSFRTY